MLNLVACVILVVFNALLGVWPMVGMNIVLVAINVWFIVRMLRDRHDETAFEVLEVGPTTSTCATSCACTERTSCGSSPTSSGTTVPGATRTRSSCRRATRPSASCSCAASGDTADVLLDYVTPRYRDFSPGEFVWRKQRPAADHGIRRVVTSPGMVGAYYDRLGFRREGESYVLEL